MADEDKECTTCPPGQILKDGRCVLPEVTFTTLVMSLNTTALCHLGEIEEPSTKEKKVDLMLAKHAIDTLELLKRKTSGNLTDQEKELLDNVLYDLKMRYVRTSG